MALSLKSSGGGSVTIADPASTASNFTLNPPLRSGQLAVDGPAFSAYPSAAVSLSNVTQTVMTCNIEDFDIGGCYNNTGSAVTLNGLSVPAYAFCPNVPGYYLISCTSFLNTTAGTIQANIYKNGAGVALSASCPNISNGVGPSVSKIMYLNGTSDYVQFTSYQTSGSTQNTLANRPDLIGFSGSLVRAA